MNTWVGRAVLPVPDLKIPASQDVSGYLVEVMRWWSSSRVAWVARWLSLDTVICSGISARIRSCLANVVSTRASFWAPDLVVAMMEVGQKNPY